jgi:outer membrane lipoprotein-sorting protein
MKLNRSLGLCAVCALAVVAIAARSENLLLAGFASAINGAKTLKTDYLVQEIGGVREDYSVTLKKPNFAKIDTPTQLIVANGLDVVTYDKQEKTYYHQAETPQLLKGLFTTEPLKTWAGFFDSSAYNVDAGQDLGTVMKGEKSYNAVKTSLDSLGDATVTYFLDPDDKIARQAEFENKRGLQSTTLLVRTRTFELNAAAGDDSFAFTPPPSSKEVTLAEVLASKWYDSLEEAEKIAAATHRNIFIDFADAKSDVWHSFVKEVLTTDKFKKAADKKKLVLCRLTGKFYPRLLTRFKVTAVPGQAIVDAKGTYVDSNVGYAGADTFYDWLNSVPDPSAF